MNSGAFPRWAWGLFALSAVARLVYVSHDEIRAFPYDEAAYIAQAAAGYWGSDYNDTAYSRPPGYPLVLAAMSALGMPARVGIELAWIAACGVVARVLRNAGVRPEGCVLAAALLLIHPFPTELFNRALADNLYTLTWLVAASSCAGAVSARDRRSIVRWGTLATLASALNAITRQEAALTMVFLVIVGGIAALAADRRLRSKLILWSAAIPLLGAVVADQGVKAVNAFRIGAYVTYDWSTPAFAELYRTLLMIPPDQPRPDVPIPRDVRRRAAAASPAYARMLRVMSSDPSCVPYWRAGVHTTGLRGEPGHYNLWLMRRAAWILGPERPPDISAHDQLYRQITRELRTAMDEGRLERRWAPFSFIPPEWGLLARRLPGDVAATLRALGTISFSRDQPYIVAPGDLAQFDAVALRRGSLVELQPGAGRGTALERKSPRPAPAWVDSLDAFKVAVAERWFGFNLTAGALVVTGIVAAAGWGRRRGLPPAWWGVMLVLLAACVLRIALVAVMNATGIVVQPRYAMPAAVLLVPMAILGVRAIVSTVRRPVAPGPRAPNA